MSAPVQAPFELDPALLSALQNLQFKAHNLMEGFLSGRHKSPFHGFNVEFVDYRNYQPGDDLRHLDWRLYARSDRLCLKRYRHETNLRFYMLCDASASMAYRGRAASASKLEVAKILSVALGWLLLRQNDAPGLVALGSAKAVPAYLPPSQKPAQFGGLLRQVAEIQSAGGPCLSELLAHALRLAHRRSVLLLFSDLLEGVDDVAAQLKQLRSLQHEIIVFQILDPDEIDFPFPESAVFQDPESGLRRLVNPANARSRYLENFERFMSQYRRIFLELEIPHTLVRTDQQPISALAFFLSNRSAPR